MPEMGEVTKYNTCKEWYHMNMCVNVPDVVSNDKAANWYCNCCNC